MYIDKIGKQFYLKYNCCHENLRNDNYDNQKRIVNMSGYHHLYK